MYVQLSPQHSKHYNMSINSDILLFYSCLFKLKFRYSQIQPLL